MPTNSNELFAQTVLKEQFCVAAVQNFCWVTELGQNQGYYSAIVFSTKLDPFTLLCTRSPSPLSRIILSTDGYYWASFCRQGNLLFWLQWQPELKTLQCRFWLAGRAKWPRFITSLSKTLRVGRKTELSWHRLIRFSSVFFEHLRMVPDLRHNCQILPKNPGRKERETGCCRTCCRTNRASCRMSPRARSFARRP